MQPSSLGAMLLLAAALAGPALAACGNEAGSCRVPGGAYQAELPPGPVKGAVVFVHGYQGSGEGTMRNRGMVDAVLARGYAVIAPDGSPMAGREGLKLGLPLWRWRAR